MRPAVKLRVGGSDRTAFVVPQAQGTQLTTHIFDIRHRRRARVGSGLNRILLSRQTKSVIAQGVQHVFAQQAVKPGEHIRGDIPQRVTHVQARARRVREHVLHEEFVFGKGGAVCRG